MTNKEQSETLKLKKVLWFDQEEEKKEQKMIIDNGFLFVSSFFLIFIGALTFKEFYGLITAIIGCIIMFWFSFGIYEVITE